MRDVGRRGQLLCVGRTWCCWKVLIPRRASPKLNQPERAAAGSLCDKRNGSRLGKYFDIYIGKKFIISARTNERRRGAERKEEREGGEKTSKSFPLSVRYIFFLLSSSSTISTRLHPCPYSFITKITFFSLSLYHFCHSGRVRTAAPG